jgi:drug/metabolite transporter (DMT)-like permease
MDRNRQLPPWQASFVLLSAIWGASFMFIKVGLEGLDPLEVALARCAFGAVALLVLLGVMREPLPRDGRLWARLFLVAIFFNSVPFSLFSFGEQHVSSVVAGIWNASSPLCTVLFAMAMLPEEQPTRARLAGLAIGFVGVLVVLGPWRDLGGSSLLGNLLCFGPAVCYGFAWVYTRKHLSGRPESFVSLSAAQVTLGAIQLAIVTPFFSSAPSHASLKVWASMLALGALGTGIAYVLNYDVIHRAGATTASSVTYVVPVFATLFGVALLSEGLSWNEPVGALAIIAGVAVSQGLLRRRAQPVALRTSPGSP